MTKKYEHITVTPITGSLGAEITDVDVSKPLDDDDFREIYDAFVTYQAIFIKDQDLTPEQHTAFSTYFGDLMVMPFVDHMVEHPRIVNVTKEPDEKNISNFGGEWHSDYSFLEIPPSTTTLYAREVPPYGGDTIWANMYDAYDSLSSGMASMLGSLSLIHSGTPFGTIGQPEDQKRADADGNPLPLRSPASIKLHRKQPEADVQQEHPLVIVHPVSGRKALFMNPLYVIRIAGMSAKESKPILEYLYRHSTQPEFICRYRWSKGTIAIWDNRCTQHYALNDYDGFRRVMHRTQIEENQRAQSIYARPLHVDEAQRSSRVARGRL